MTYTVVIPVLNQLHFTRQCVDSLLANGVPDAAALVVKAGLIILAVWLQRQEHA